MIDYVKSLGEIYQQGSYIATTFKHLGNTMEKVDKSCSGTTSRYKTILVRKKCYWYGRAQPSFDNYFLGTEYE